MSNIEAAYKAFCKERFPLPSQTEVAELEKQLGIPLPSDYRQYLLQYNGGFFTEPNVLPPSKDCPLDRLTLMGGIHATHLSAELGSKTGLSPTLFEDNDPPQILPIGDTMMGNLIFLVTRPGDADYGWICLKIAFKDNSYLLAKGVEEFFGLLRKPQGT